MALYLLPGLLGTVTYDYLVEGEKRDNFERVLQALVLTLISTLLVHGVFGLPLIPGIDVGKDTTVTKIISTVLDRNLIILSAVAVVITFVWAVLHNHGVTYNVLNFLRVTYKTSKVDVWQDTFNVHRGYWIKIKFIDGRCLIGWPKYYSPTGKPRELFMADAIWWEPTEDGSYVTVEVDGPGVYISDFTKVVAIELIN